MTNLLEAPASPSTVLRAPGSPALSREQIKNRSSRGWSGSNNGSPVLPLSFRSKPQQQPSSTAMMPNPSTESAISSVDTGSPFGSLIDKFEVTARDNVRKTSASFKILDKKAVSNSPFLTGGNTSSTSPVVSTRKPFAPVAADRNPNNNNLINGFNSDAPNFRQSQSQWNTSSSSSSIASTAKHGLGLLSRPTQPPSPASAGPPFLHRRTNSDAENQNPNFLQAQNADKQKDVHVPSPATQFNAEMQAIGAPLAIDVTNGLPGLPTPDLGRDFTGTESPEVDVRDSPSTAFKPRKGPRPSVATLGGRGAVSSSPFLQNGLPQVSSVPMAQRQTSSHSSSGHSYHSATTDSPVSRDELDLSPLPAPPSLPRRGSKQMLGPRGPSYTDLKAQAEAQDGDVEHLAEYNEDAPLQGVLYSHTLERKASRKSVKWAEVEEVCEYDVETEDGGSRRSSAASSNSMNVDDEDEDHSSYEEDLQQRLNGHESASQHPYEQYEQEDEEYYDNYRHSSLEPDVQENAEMTVRASTPPHSRPLGNGLPRDFSIMSEHASIIEQHPDDSLDANADPRMYLSNGPAESEVQNLISKIDSATLESQARPLHIESDLFGSGGVGNEFGVIRTPHTSLGQSSFGSEMSTPQALNTAGSASRRPLPPPPTASSAPASPTKERNATTEDGLLKADDSQYSLMDMDFSSSPFLPYDELGLTRKESLKRARQQQQASKSSATPSALSQEILASDKQDDANTSEFGIERSISPRPRLTAEEVRESLRKRPGSAFAALRDTPPLASTPPSGNSIRSKTALPDLSGSTSGTGPASTSRAGPSKAIPARPAPSPIKISSEQLPTLRSGTPSPLPPSPSKSTPPAEPESALDRLMRETAGQPAPGTAGMRRIRSSSSSSSQSMEADEPAGAADGKGKIKAGAFQKPKNRRRSRSTGDAEDLLPGPMQKILRGPNPPGFERMESAPVSSSKIEALTLRPEDAFGPQLGQALDSVITDHDRGYRVREQFRGSVAYTRPEDINVATIGLAGDIETGKAWKKIRRPSDINEHRSQLREYKQTSATRKEKRQGILFVKVGKLILNSRLPLPSQATYISCTLANHKHLVQTPYARITADKTMTQVNIASEFELVADENLEMTLSFKVRRDAHLQPARIHEPLPASPGKLSKHSHSNSASGGFRAGLQKLLSSPRKPKGGMESRPSSRLDMAPSPVPAVAASPPILEYLNSKDDIATYHLKASDVIGDCSGTKLVQIYSCQPALGAKRGMRDVAKVELHLFYVPPMPEVPIKDLPQSIEECLNGLKEVDHYEKSYFEGVLTQQGADCMTWRRRQMRLKGSRLIAFNEVTRKAYVTIDLTKAVSLEDPDEPALPPTPATASTAVSGKAGLASPGTFRTASTAVSSQHRRTRSMDDDDDPFATRPHSFKLIFEDDAVIDFFADDAGDKLKWVAALRSVITKSKKAVSATPPLWAQLLHAANKERRTAATALKKADS